MNVCNALLLLPLILCSCATTRTFGDPYGESPRVEVTRNQFDSFEFKAFPKILGCDGSIARSKLEFSLTVKPPIPTKGLPVSLVAKDNVEFYQAVGSYLRNDFLWNASSPELQSDNFKECKNYRVYTGDSGAQGTCWIKGSNDRNVLNRNVKTLVPVLLAHAPDLSLLRQNFVFATSDISSESTLNNSDSVWRLFLSKAEWEEADQEDGSKKYKVTLKMDDFCKYGIPVSDLLSK